MKDPNQAPSRSKDGLLQKGERNKLIGMSALLVIVLVAFFTSRFQQSKHEERQGARVADEEPEFVETVVVPPFTAAEEVAAQVLDNRPEDRVLLPSKVLAPYLDYSRGFSDAQFQAMDLRELTPELHAEISANPAAFRAQPFRVRGFLGDIKSIDHSDGTREYRGWLTMPGGEVSHFIVSELDDDPVLDGYMRVDGLFLKLYRRKGQLGQWAEGPLFVGARAVRSFPESEPYDAEVLQARLDKIEDDSATRSTGLDGYVFDAQWLLMDYANSEAGAAIEWDSENVLELDNEVMVDVLKNGSKYRGKPFRIPVSKNMGIWTRNAGENPSRLDQITTGWIGNWTWSNQAGVIKFVMPAFRPDLQDAELVEARGFFLKNFNYEPRDGGTRQAPYFVLTDITEFVPERSFLAENLMYVVVGITLFLIALFPLLLLRDKKKSEALQRDLVRRKQERRRRLTAQSPQG